MNLAIIVHRLLTSPRGYSVERLREDLEIAPRTYRKYRALLRDEFAPFLRRDGRSAVVEIEEDGDTYLRLRPLRDLGAASPEFDIMTAAVHIVCSMLTQTGVDDLVLGADSIMGEFHASLRDPRFIRQYALREAERMFVSDRAPIDDVDTVHVLIRAIINRHKVRVRTTGFDRTVAPLSLILRSFGLMAVLLVDDSPVEFNVSELDSVEMMPEKFEYPSALRYEPPV